MAGDDITHDDDPFAIFLGPPGGETSSERAIREAREAEAKKRSEAIDEELRTEKQTRIRTSRGLLKAVLIGDSRSGTSTPLISVSRAL
jgi:guanine nucleotide-binding protein subunit alpha